jgi:hypothetical protein
MATVAHHLGGPLPRASNSGGEGSLRDQEPLHRVAALTPATGPSPSQKTTANPPAAVVR